jgi:hypothetical protein
MEVDPGVYICIYEARERGVRITGFLDFTCRPEFQIHTRKHNVSDTGSISVLW